MLASINGSRPRRRSRALKLWLMFKVYGAGRIAAGVQRGIELAELAQELIERDPSWEVVTPAQLGIVTFTRPEWSAEAHAERAAAISDDGYAAVTSTVLRGRTVLRLCTINPRTTERDIAETLRRLGA